MPQPHRYVIGDEISLAFGFFDRDAVGIYGVTRLLPAAMDGELQYRIKGEDGRERVISESQIARGGFAGHLRPRFGSNPITEMFNGINRGASALELARDIDKAERIQPDPTS